MCVSSRISIISAHFQRLSHVLKKISPLRGNNVHSAKIFLEYLPADVFNLASNTKLDQVSQQDTHCRTAFLQNSSLGAPVDIGFF